MLFTHFLDTDADENIVVAFIPTGLLTFSIVLICKICFPGPCVVCLF